ncbi:hypothetical protein [Bacillus thuringiensis]|uniref:hypothetical protein n=1 Tax=Bacillus thuringiensis TaxID=1428 RepID=UPI0021556BE7|nr:hypothetical protein [Bacillus thuringiensis]
MEIVAVQYSDDTTDVNVGYTLRNVDSKNEESDAIDGTYKGKFKNIKKGTCELKITNHSDEIVYGNFYAYY